ncbi:GLPGLI family protein [Polaribacter porphyrae]|uniref:Ribonuclease Z n=1 Tax=Polaribacter porphyrae TaxID=1137780 RepID=A0A2S7WU88_9FLAO|nr:GLPGLI family protein [Polaribacter porphyrae]PQJ81046.1 ribonuclease Z [Polaribacter porphyrae]
MKSLLSAIFLIATLTTFAQKDFQGKAVYMSKSTVDMSSWGRNGQLSEAQKKQIAARMKSMLEKTFILNFNKLESVYKEDEKLAAPTMGGGRSWGGFSGGGIKYKNTKDRVALESKEFFGKNFLISDSMEQPKWELSTESKKIGNYTCYKATMMKDVDPLDWTNMRRRGRKNNTKKDENKKDEAKKDSSNVRKISDEIEMPKQIEVTAWYSPQIPVSNGPGEYWGLPGLILEINAGRTTILCTEIIMNPSEKVDIKKPTKGTEVTRAEYNKTITDKMQQFRESRGRRGRGRRF